jgi:ribosomal protein S14
MRARRLTLSGRAPHVLSAAFLLLPAAAIVTPRAIPKNDLSRVPLRDLALEAQYAEVKEALQRYREPEDPTPPEGATRCGTCGTLSPEDLPRCPCGAFLHRHLLYTCPSCTRVVARDARDCNRCGTAFWSAVNPPDLAVTEDMVAEYMDAFSKSDLS